MQIIIIIILLFVMFLGSWTIFHGKGSSLTTNINRQTTKTVITESTENILHSSYKGLQGTQRSSSKGDQLQPIISTNDNKSVQ